MTYTTLLAGRSLEKSDTDGCVSALLGGKTKDKVPVYCTTARPDLAQGLGFVGAKYPLAYGPADGNAGLKKNVEIHKKWRAAGAHPLPALLDRPDRWPTGVCEGSRAGLSSDGGLLHVAHRPLRYPAGQAARAARRQGAPCRPAPHPKPTTSVSC